MKKRSKRIVGGVAVFAAAALIVYGFLPEPIDVDIATAERGPLEVTLSEEGRTRVAQRYTVSAPVSGYAHRMSWEVGDEIEQGETILQLQAARSELLDPRRAAQARAQLDAARAAASTAEARAHAADVEAQVAETELQRVKALHDDGSATSQQLNAAEANAARAVANQRSARHAVTSAQAEVAAAEAALQMSGAAGRDAQPIRSPSTGRILEVYHEDEGAVQVGQRLLEIGNPNDLEVEIQVLSSDAVRIDPGARVVFSRWGGEDTLEGSVRRIEPVGYTKVSALGVEEQRVKVIAGITSPRERWERLGDGYRVEAAFVLWESDDVLQVPASAIFRSDSGWAVFRVDGDRARLHSVEIGQRGGLRAEVLSGLEAGDRVVTHPDDRLNDGARINVLER